MWGSNGVIEYSITPAFQYSPIPISPTSHSNTPMKTTIVKRNLWITFFVFPGLLMVSLFIILPLFLSMFNSLYEWDGLVRTRFIGVQNFISIFFNFPYQERFFNAVKNNMIWFIVTMIFQNCTGLVFGYLLSKKIRGYILFSNKLNCPAIFFPI